MTRSASPAENRGILTEVKHHLDGRRDEWPCEALSVTKLVAAVRFVLPDPIQDVPAGTETLGFFWLDRPYNLYRFVAPDLGYRFDVVTDVRIEPDRIEYLDLYSTCAFCRVEACAWRMKTRLRRPHGVASSPHRDWPSSSRPGSTS